MAFDLREDALLLEATQRDPSAFRQIFLRYFDPVYRYAALRTASTTGAEAVAVRVFQRARADLAASPAHNRPLLPWLLDLARQAIATEPPTARSARAAVAAAEPAPPAGAGTCTAAPLGRLDHAAAEVLVLRFVAGCEFADIAAATMTSPGAVKLRLYRTVVRLARRLGSNDDG